MKRWGGRRDTHPAGTAVHRGGKERPPVGAGGTGDPPGAAAGGRGAWRKSPKRVGKQGRCAHGKPQRPGRVACRGGPEEEAEACTTSGRHAYHQRRKNERTAEKSPWHPRRREVAYWGRDERSPSGKWVAGGVGTRESKETGPDREKRDRSTQSNRRRSGKAEKRRGRTVVGDGCT